MKPSVKLLYRRIKTMAMVLSISGFKECCIFDEVKGMEDKEKVENAGSKDESANSKYETDDENCEDIRTETGERSGGQIETDEAE
jgi:hypothetical protein